MSLNRSKVTEVATEVAAALEAIAEKHGLQYNRKNGSFNDSMYRASFEFTVVSADGVDQREVDVWNHNKFRYKDLDDLEIGAKSPDLLTEFVKYNPRAKAYPFVVKQGGKSYKMTPGQFRSAFGRSILPN